MEERTRYAAAVCLALASPLATSTLVGDVSSEGFTEDPARPHGPGARDPVAGRGPRRRAGRRRGRDRGTVLGRAFYLGRLRRGWLATVVLPPAAGVVVGFGARLVTAGGIGANIGGGMFLIIGVPVVVVLLVAAAANAWVESRG
ncbi:MAG: hypothetical protein M3203_00960 [Actinomycetota bacterium]|nr:hypothetical protein [Actinomycetota bacterium]